FRCNHDVIFNDQDAHDGSILAVTYLKVVRLRLKFDENVVPKIEMVGSSAGSKPHQGGRNLGHQKLGHALGLGGVDLAHIFADHDQVQEVFFAFELVAEFPYSAAEGVWFDADTHQSELVAGTRQIGVEVGQSNHTVGSHCGEQRLDNR